MAPAPVLPGKPQCGQALERRRLPGWRFRPFLVLRAERVAAALRAAVTDPTLRDRPLLGAVDQYVHSVDVLSDATRARRVADGLWSGAAVTDQW